MCGGTEHPTVAVHADLLSVSDAQLDASRDAVRRADEAVMAAAAARQAAQGNLAQAEARLADLAELVDVVDVAEAPGARDQGGEAAAQALAADIVRLDTALAAAQRAQARLQALEPASRAARTSHEAAVVRARDAEVALQREAQAAAQLEGEWRAACAQVPEDLRDPVALEATLARVRAQAAALDAALQAAQAAEREAASQLAAAVAARDAARTHLTQADARHAHAEGALAQAIAAAGFADAATWRPPACRRPRWWRSTRPYAISNSNWRARPIGANAPRQKPAICRSPTCRPCRRRAMPRRRGWKPRFASAAS